VQERACCDSRALNSRVVIATPFNQRAAPHLRAPTPPLPRPRASSGMLLRRLLLRPRRCARALSSAAAAAAAAAAPPSIAIVGSGPSGFYAAKYLLKDDPLLRVDVLDILPSPFGAPRRARVRARACARAPSLHRRATCPDHHHQRALSLFPQASCAAAWRRTTRR
jgi:hypothetical protein